jgi:hypothetical protein
MQTQFVGVAVKAISAQLCLRGRPAKDASLFLAAVTIRELGRGVKLIRHRGIQPQEERLEQ